jgi:hypothetical protein
MISSPRPVGTVDDVPVGHQRDRALPGLRRRDDCATWGVPPRGELEGIAVRASWTDHGHLDGALQGGLRRSE